MPLLGVVPAGGGWRVAAHGAVEEAVVAAGLGAGQSAGCALLVPGLEGDMSPTRVLELERGHGSELVAGTRRVLYNWEATISDGVWRSCTFLRRC